MSVRVRFAPSPTGFLHVGAATGGKANHGQFVFQRDVDTAHETFAHDRAHRAAAETKLESGCNQGHTLDPPHLNHQRVFLTGGFLFLGNLVFVLLAALELENVYRFDFFTDLDPRFAVQELAQATASGLSQVVAALGTNVEVSFQLSLVQHAVARRALRPKTLGYRPFAFGLGADAGGYELSKLTHRF